MDWNVFFSTVSQTSGAIVGIFAAFLITKIVSNQSDFNKNKEKLSNHISNSESLSHETEIRYFKWYNERILNQELDKIEGYFYDKKDLSDAETYYKELNFSPFEEKNKTIQEINGKLNELKKIKQENERIRMEALRNSPNGIWGNHYELRQPIKPLSNINLITELNEEIDQIRQLIVRITKQSSLNKQLYHDLKLGESSSLITISIIAVLFLFFSGVIYPLSFLPLDSNGYNISLSLSLFLKLLFSLKGLILTIISIIFGFLMLAFLIVNIKLKYNKNNLNTLLLYSDIEHYSEYLKNYKQNKEDS